jgi:hypothetical protein
LLLCFYVARVKSNRDTDEKWYLGGDVNLMLASFWIDVAPSASKLFPRNITFNCKQYNTFAQDVVCLQTRTQYPR